MRVAKMRVDNACWRVLAFYVAARSSRNLGRIAGEIDRKRLKLEAIEARAVFQRPQTIVDERRQRCDDLIARSERAIKLKVERLQQRLATTAASMEALSPLKVLSRGYSVTTAADGRIVVSVEQVESGQQIHTRLADGTITSIVDEEM